MTKKERCKNCKRPMILQVFEDLLCWWSCSYCGATKEYKKKK